MKKFTLLFSLALFGTLNLMAQSATTPGGSVTTPGTTVIQAPVNAGTATLNSQPVEPAVVLPVTTISWTETNYNFGTIEQGTPVSHKFTFTNTGENDLVITEVKRTCGCTKLEWIKEAVKPGESGWVEAEFNAAMAGQFSKTIFFNANIVPNPIGLTFQGEVKPKEQLNLQQNNTIVTTPDGTTPTPH